MTKLLFDDLSWHFVKNEHVLFLFNMGKYKCGKELTAAMHCNCFIISKKSTFIMCQRCMNHANTQTRTLIFYDFSP